ncbi:hypothetical protein NE237_004365 [Protea cynaroides]|uniref:Metal tolerance protein 1-like n=1 Tax=Protea cynaroides TaxID=273540 RepID=A0A9Q0KJA6_9MAGN|nr:hypothetical protein NE237_004365 [Protea cynaroides]
MSTIKDNHSSIHVDSDSKEEYHLSLEETQYCSKILNFFRTWISLYQMEDQSPHHRHQIVEVCGDVTKGSPSLGGIKVCGEAPCGFSDAGTVLKDAKERSASMRKLLMAVALCVVFMSVEVAGGIKANSLAILTDAAHLLSDVAAFAISLFSLWASGWEATPRQSYGFFRIEILGALVSIQLIWVLAGILVYEAIARLIHDTGEVQGFLMFVVAAFGLLVNIIMACLLGHDHGHSHGHSGHDHDQSHNHGHGHGHSHHTHGISIMAHHGEQSKQHDEHDHVHDADQADPLLEKSSGDALDAQKAKACHEHKKQRNINVQGAYLHVIGDSIQSIGVMIGGAIIWMLRNILEVLMESTPREIDATMLENGLREMDEVVAVHELHIWAITVGKVLLACHVKIQQDADADLVLEKVIDYIRREYNISHVTIQIER